MKRITKRNFRESKQKARNLRVNFFQLCRNGFLFSAVAICSTSVSLDNSLAQQHSIIDRTADYRLLRQLQLQIAKETPSKKLIDRTELFLTCKSVVENRLTEVANKISSEELAQIESSLMVDCNKIRDQFIPTEFEHPFFYNELANVLDSVRQAHVNLRDKVGASEVIRSAEPVKTVKFGTLSTSCANALVFPDSYDGRPLIVWKQGLGRVIRSWASLVGKAVVVSDSRVSGGMVQGTMRFGQESIKILSTDVSFFKNLLRALLSLHTTSELIHEEQNTISISAHLSAAMMTFVTAHEYAHLILGHRKPSTENMQLSVFSAIDTESTADNGVARPLNNIVVNHKQELEADAVALELFWETIREIDNRETIGPRLLIWAPDIYFSFLAHSQSARYSFELGRKVWGFDASKTHPNAEVRRKKIREAILALPLKIDRSAKYDMGKYVYDLLDTSWQAMDDSVFFGLGDIVRDMFLKCGAEK